MRILRVADHPTEAIVQLETRNVEYLLEQEVRRRYETMRTQQAVYGEVQQAILDEYRRCEPWNPDRSPEAHAYMDYLWHAYDTLRTVHTQVMLAWGDDEW